MFWICIACYCDPVVEKILLFLVTIISLYNVSDTISGVSRWINMCICDVLVLDRVVKNDVLAFAVIFAWGGKPVQYCLNKTT